MENPFVMTPPSPLSKNNELRDLDELESGLIPYHQVAGEDLSRIGTFLDSETETVEKIIADELEKLSLVEHEKIVFDVHGITQVDQEDPENVNEMLGQVETEIGNIRSKHAYDLAKYLNESYVNDLSFRLRFLRCDRFDCKLAAQRIVRHFDVKRGLFGDGEVLARDVRLSDLSEKDMKALESGFLQVLPSRDAAGRSIFSIAPMHRPDDCSVENCGKAMWYIFNTTMKDEETQRNGIVGIVSNFGEHARREPLSLMRELHRMKSGVPKKFVGVHYCYDDASLKPFVAGVRLFLAKEMRTRFRPHFGDRENIAFELQTFGIPTKDHPILANGTLSLEWHREWLNVRRTQEESASTKDGMIIPRRFDVLFGRGRNTREHTGNLRAAHLVEMYQTEYEQANKWGKTAVSQRILEMIHESYGRFLRWEGKGWVEVDAETAREKISHFFRHLRSKTNSKDEATGESTQAGSTTSAKRVTPCPSPIHSPFDDGSEKSTKHAREIEE